jgi:hypothetical protein
VASLKQKGAVALPDAQLRALIVGKSIWMQNTVTGGMFQAVFQEDGRYIVYNVGKSALLPSVTGNVVQNGYLGTTSGYSIQNGQIVTSVADSPYTMTIYKAGDTYYAARSNEFGYANYQILPKPPNNLVNLGKGESQEPGAAD